MTHICVSKLTIIASDNGLSPNWRQAIIWTSAGLLLIGPLGTKFSEIIIEILTFSFKKCAWKCRLRNGVHFVSASMWTHIKETSKSALLALCVGNSPVAGEFRIQRAVIQEKLPFYDVFMWCGVRSPQLYLKVKLSLRLKYLIISYLWFHFSSAVDIICLGFSSCVFM